MRRKSIPAYVRRSAFWLSVVGVTTLSLLPAPWLPPVAFDVWDKAQHALAFVLLGGLGLWAYATSSGRIVLGLLAYGALIEVVQSFTGWRYGDWQDWLADAVGVGVTYLGWVLWKPSRSHGQTSTP